MQGFSTAQTRTGNNNKVKLDDLVDVVKLPPNKWVQMRLVGPYTSIIYYWITIIPKEGAKEVTIPKMATNWNPDIQDFEGECPYGKAFKSGKYKIRMDKKFLTNAIIRSLQEKEPKNSPKRTKSERKLKRVIENDEYEAYIKDKNSKSFTAAQVLRAAPTLVEHFKGLTDLNTKKNKKTGKVVKKELSDPNFGIDVQVKFDPDAKGTAMYQAQRDKRTPLTDEEKEMLLWKLDVLKPESLEKATEEWKNLKSKVVEADEEDEEKKGKSKKGGYLDEDDDDEDEPKSKKKKKKNKSSDDDDSFDADSLDADDDDEDESKSKKKKKKKKKGGFGK